MLRTVQELPLTLAAFFLQFVETGANGTTGQLYLSVELIRIRLRQCRRVERLPVSGVVHYSLLGEGANGARGIIALLSSAEMHRSSTGESSITERTIPAQDQRSGAHRMYPKGLRARRACLSLYRPPGFLRRRSLGDLPSGFEPATRS